MADWSPVLLEEMSGTDVGPRWSCLVRDRQTGKLRAHSSSPDARWALSLQGLAPEVLEACLSALRDPGLLLAALEVMAI